MSHGERCPVCGGSGTQRSSRPGAMTECRGCKGVGWVAGTVDKCIDCGGEFVSPDRGGRCEACFRYFEAEARLDAAGAKGGGDV